MAAQKKPQGSPSKRKVADKAATEQGMTTPKAPWWKTTWAKLLSIAAFFGAVLGIPPLVNSFVEGTAKLPTTSALVVSWVRGDRHFAGEWTNDPGPANDEAVGSLGPPLVDLETRARPSAPFADDGAVSLRIDVKDGSVTGEITSKGIRDHFLYSHMPVSGVVSFGTLKLHVWDYVAGTASPIAGLKAKWEKVGDEERLEFTSGGVLFPAHFDVKRGTGPQPSFNLAPIRQSSSHVGKAESGKSVEADKR